MKPILHVVVPKKQSKYSASYMKTMSNAIKKVFSDKYDIIFSQDDINLIADNSTVVRFEINDDMNIRDFVDQLNFIASKIEDPKNDYKNYIVEGPETVDDFAIEIDDVTYQTPLTHKEIGSLNADNGVRTEISVGLINMDETGDTGAYIRLVKSLIPNEDGQVDFNEFIQQLGDDDYSKGFVMKLKDSVAIDQMISSLEFILKILKGGN